MDIFLTIILVAIVLGADSFSLALGMGLNGAPRRYEFKFSGMVGIFHVLMPLIGLYLGMAAGHILGVWAGRLGGAVLVYLGVEMVWKGYIESRNQFTTLAWGTKSKVGQMNFDEGWIKLLILTTSVSIDALTIGFSLGTFWVGNVPFAVLILGLVAGLMTMAGFKGGRFFSRLIGSYAQIAGGLVLLVLAYKMVF